MFHRGFDLSQVLRPGSFAELLRKAGETSNAFELAGLVNGIPIAVLGMLTFFFEEWPQQVAEIVIGAWTVGTVSL